MKEEELRELLLEVMTIERSFAGDPSKTKKDRVARIRELIEQAADADAG